MRALKYVFLVAVTVFSFSALWAQGKIAFTDYNKVYKYYCDEMEVILVDTTAEKQNTPSAVQWSPDGQYLAFLSYEDSLKVIQEETGNEYVIYKGNSWSSWSGGYIFNWSPKREEITFGHWDKTYFFYVPMESLQVICDSPGYVKDTDIVESPANQRLAYVHHEHGYRYWIYMVDPDCGNSKLLTEEYHQTSLHDEDVELEWFPEGDMLIYKLAKDGIYTVDTLGTGIIERVDVSDQEYDLASLDLSPDGELCAYAIGLNLVVINTTTWSNPETLVTFPPYDNNGIYEIVWSDDMESFGVSTVGGVYVVDAQSGDYVKIFEYYDPEGKVSVSWSGPGCLPVGIEPDEPEVKIPRDFKLSQNFPNPFNPSTTISFELPKEMSVTVKIYDLRGQLVKTLISEQKEVGQHQVFWDGTDEKGLKVPSGIYLYRLQTPEFVTTKKMVLLK